MSAFVQNERSDAVKSYNIPLKKLRDARKQEKEAQKKLREVRKQEKEAQKNKLREAGGRVLETNVGPFLEPHHTHFLLVDNGTNGQFHTEIPLRAKLEAHIVASSVPLI